MVSVGSKALLRREDTSQAEPQKVHVTSAAESLATMADDHDLVVIHQNGQQAGLPAIDGAEESGLTVADALGMPGPDTQESLGTCLLQDLGNALPGREIVSLDPPDARRRQRLGL